MLTLGFHAEGIYDKFLAKFKEYTAQTRVGDPFDESTFQGPQISQTQYDRIMSYIEAGKSEGATCYMGGSRVGDKGYFIQPTIFTDVKSSMKIMQEEIFGPVVAVAKFKTVDEVIEMAHDTVYGLAAAVFTQNVTQAITVANRLEAGTVWVNCYNQLDYNTPFGGYRQSGIGRENGEYALDNYTQVWALLVLFVPIDTHHVPRSHRSSRSRSTSPKCVQHPRCSFQAKKKCKEKNPQKSFYCIDVHISQPSPNTLVNASFYAMAMKNVRI